MTLPPRNDALNHVTCLIQIYSKLSKPQIDRNIMYQYLDGILLVCCFEGFAIDTYGLLHLRILDCAQIGQIPLLQHVYLSKDMSFSAVCEIK